MLLLLWILALLCFNPANTHGVTKDSLEVQESEEFENAVVENVREDYRNGFVKLLNFIDSINNTLTALNTKLAGLDTEFANLNAKFDAHTVEFNALKATIAAQNTALNARDGQLSRTTNLLLRTVFHLNKSEGFDTFIRMQAKEIRTGKSFNGLTLSNIKSRVEQAGSSGRYIVVVFVNLLDEVIGDFKIYDRGNTIYNPAPESVPARTQEIFTFSHPYVFNRHVDISFSYSIASFDVQIAVRVQGTYGAGLAFFLRGVNMETYFIYHEGIEGSSVWDCCGGHVDRKLSVGYKNLYARIFADQDGDDKATFRIELIKLPLDD